MHEYARTKCYIALRNQQTIHIDSYICMGAYLLLFYLRNFRFCCFYDNVSHVSLSFNAKVPNGRKLDIRSVKAQCPKTNVKCKVFAQHSTNMGLYC